jgi:hypothetical protein
MRKPAPFTQAQVKRAITAAKKAGLRIIGIRPDGTVIIYDGEGPIEEALRSALGCEPELPVRNESDAVSAFDEWTAQQEAQRPERMVASHQAPLVGEAWQQHVEKSKEWVRGRPLGIREKRALRELSTIKGQQPRRINGAGPGTMDRLEARGFVRTVGEVKPGRVPLYELTEAGEVEWLRIRDTQM